MVSSHSAYPRSAKAPTYAIARYSDLSSLPKRYEAAFSKAGDASVFHTLQWYRNFIETVPAPDETLRIFAVESNAPTRKEHAVLLMRYRKPSHGVFGTRTLAALSNYYTSLFGPIIDSEVPEFGGLLDSLAAAIVGDTFRLDLVDVHPLDKDAPGFCGLVAAFKNAGLLVQTYFCFGNWYLKVRGRSYAEYFESLPSQLRSTIRRKARQFERYAKSRIVVYRNASNLEEGLNAYEQIYAASWKVPEPYPKFIRGLCTTCAELGWLRLGVIYVDDQPAAAQIWIVKSGIANIYKLAYDARFARLSAGTVLTAHLMHHVIDIDKVHEVDYLTGDDTYKKDWMSDRRERWGIMAFNPRTLMGLLLGIRHLGGRALRNAVGVVREFGRRQRADRPTI